PQLPPSFFPHSYEPGVRHGVYDAMVLWLLGYVEQARQRGQATLARAQQLEHTPSLGGATIHASLLAQFGRDVGAAQTHTALLRTGEMAHDFPFRAGQGALLPGRARALQGDPSGGIALISQGIASSEHVGLQVYRPYFLTLLAEAYAQAGQPEAGLARP